MIYVERDGVWHIVARADDAEVVTSVLLVVAVQGEEHHHHSDGD